MQHACPWAIRQTRSPFCLYTPHSLDTDLTYTGRLAKLNIIAQKALAEDLTAPIEGVQSR